MPTKALRYGVRTTIWSIVVAVGVLLFIMWAAIAAYVVISRHDAIDESASKGRNLAIAFREELATLIVTAVISMGRSLKLRVVAEGVETAEELAFLRAHHCDEAQGYYFSRPVLPERFAKLLETGVTEFGRHGLLAEGAEPGPAARTAPSASIVQVQGSPVRAVSAPSRDRNPSATREAS